MWGSGAGVESSGRGSFGLVGVPELLKGSWEVETRAINTITELLSFLITPIKVGITLLPKSHDPPSTAGLLVFRR